MTGAAMLLLINVAVTGFFAAAFAAVTFIASRERAALWFAGAYGVGTLTPLSEFLLPMSPMPELLAFSSYASFLGGPLLIPIGLAAVHGGRRPWRAFWAILAGGLLLRIAIWNGTRNTLAYDLAYQLPFALAAILACHTVLRSQLRGGLRGALAWLFAIIAVQFMIKPFLAVAFGSGRTAGEYVHSSYAIFSQASTAILLVAAGLMILLSVVQKAIHESQLASETDPLSRLANRRGFDRQGEQLIARAESRSPLAAVLFDLDHFKRINDSLGHSTGDAVIAAFGESLRRAAPPGTVVGRIGGEEFALLLPGFASEAAWRKAESVRIALAASGDDTLPRATVSGGVAEWRPGDRLGDLLRRADKACYDAKQGGRNRICIHSTVCGTAKAKAAA